MDFSKVRSYFGFLRYEDRPYPNGSSDTSMMKWAVAVAAIILIAINFIRMFDNNFWSDEIYSINVAHMSFSEIFDYSVNVDSHPPLFNFMLAAMCKLFGESPFVYHFTAMIPYIGMLILGATVVRKWFGTVASLTFMLLCTLLDSSMYNIPEVRMYELGAFLVLASYISFYLVLKNGTNKEYILFVVCSLLAAYTHYYCLIAVAMLYVFLIIKFLAKHDWKGFKRFFIFGLITVVGYLPWFFISLKERVEYNTGNFWIETTPNILECLLYIFSGKIQVILLLSFTAMIIILCVRRLKRDTDKTAGLMKRMSGFDTDGLWIAGGLFAIIGSIAFGEIISALTTPLLILRYIYPVSIIAWLIFAVAVSRMDIIKAKNLIQAILVALILVFGALAFYDTVDTEFKNAQSTEDIIACVNDNTEDGDTILTDMNHMNKTLGKYYYPNLKTVYFENNKLPEMDPGTHYILYLDNSKTIDQLNDQLTEKGYEAALLTSGSFASAYNVFVYDLQPI